MLRWSWERNVGSTQLSGSRCIWSVNCLSGLYSWRRFLQSCLTHNSLRHGFLFLVLGLGLVPRPPFAVVVVTVTGTVPRPQAESLVGVDNSGGDGRWTVFGDGIWSCGGGIVDYG